MLFLLSSSEERGFAWKLKNVWNVSFSAEFRLPPVQDIDEENFIGIKNRLESRINPSLILTCFW